MTGYFSVCFCVCVFASKTCILLSLPDYIKVTIEDEAISQLISCLGCDFVVLMLWLGVRTQTI